MESKRRIATAVAVVLMCTTGCMNTRQMALTAKSQAVDVTKQYVGLMVVATSTSFPGALGAGPRLPFAARVDVLAEGEKEPMTYLVSGDNVIVADGVLYHMVSLPLPKGRYRIVFMRGFGVLEQHIDKIDSGDSWLGSFDWPQSHPFEITTAGVTYLGRVNMHLRERQNESEPRAGGMFGILEQRVTGFYPGTFDVTISDSYESDLAMFSGRYPSLKGMQVTRSLLR
jgi:hypothetical protein